MIGLEEGTGGPTAQWAGGLTPMTFWHENGQLAASGQGRRGRREGRRAAESPLQLELHQLQAAVCQARQRVEFLLQDAACDDQQFRHRG